MLFHQGLGLLFDRSGLHRLAAFDPHRNLDSLGDFPGQAGVNLYRSLPKVTRRAGESLQIISVPANRGLWH